MRRYIQEGSRDELVVMFEVLPEEVFCEIAIDFRTGKSATIGDARGGSCSVARSEDCRSLAVEPWWSPRDSCSICWERTLRWSRYRARVHGNPRKDVKKAATEVDRYGSARGDARLTVFYLR
jgi:hypothetical protein